MKARGFVTPRGGALIGTARGSAYLGALLAGASIGLAAPVDAAPAGPDSAEETSIEQEDQGYVVIVDHLSTVPLDRAKVFGVHPGLEPQGLAGSVIYLGVG